MIGILILFLYALPALAVPVKVSTFQLANGLKVILAPMENMEAACVLLYHITGVRDDPAEIRGAAHLYETLMLSRTQTLEPMERIFFIKRYGGLSQVHVDYDYSIFSQVVPDTEIGNALWLESERLSSLQLNSRQIGNLKNIVYKRKKQIRGHNVHVKAAEYISARVFDGTIYQTPVYGNLEKLPEYSIQKIKKVYDNFRNPKSIIMVICGKFNISKVKAAVNKGFGTLEVTRPPRATQYMDPPARNKYTYDTWSEQNSGHPFALYGILAPGKASYDYLYFQFLRYYLLDPRVGRLNRLLNNLDNVEAHVTSQFTDNLETNALLIKITASRRLDLERAKYIVNRELSAFGAKTKAISASDIRMIKALMELDFKKKMRAPEHRGLLLAENYHLNGDLNFAVKYLERIRRMTLQGVTRVGKKYLKKENRNVLNVYPKQQK